MAYTPGSKGLLIITRRPRFEAFDAHLRSCCNWGVLNALRLIALTPIVDGVFTLLDNLRPLTDIPVNARRQGTAEAFTSWAKGFALEKYFCSDSCALEGALLRLQRRHAKDYGTRNGSAPTTPSSFLSP